MLKRSKSEKKASQYLEKLLKKKSWQKGDMLPSLKMLAGGAGVSTASMSSALHMLKKKGSISIIRTRGIFFGEDVHSQKSGVDPLHDWQPGPRPASKWESLKLQMEQDIFNGNFAPSNTLPALRQLQLRYGIGYKTLRKAIDAMVNEGVIKRHNLSINLFQNIQRNSYASIIFFGLSDESGGLLMQNDWQRQSVATLQDLCRKNNINFLLAGYPPLRKKHNTDNIAMLHDRYSIIGYIIWAYEMSLPMLENLIRNLSQYKKPLVIMDEMGDMHIPEEFFTYKQTKVFRLPGRNAGKQVGRYLLELGHRNIAYLSYCHKESWSVWRCQGLRQAFAEAGFEGRVTEFVLDGKDNWQRNCPPNFNMDRKLGNMDSLFKSLDRLSRQHSFPVFFKKMRGEAEDYKLLAQLTLQFSPIVKEVLANKKITAIVAANDLMALVARHNLMAYGVRIPRQISLIGYDDSNASVDYNFSSYNFSFADASHKMIMYIIDPHNKFFPRYDCNFQWDGMIVERTSTARPR
jgi:DNA-binding LacI/PurR family transcriptional regulator